MSSLLDGLLWVIRELPKPETLKTIVHLGGPPWIGYAILAAIVFSETGLLVGFFLPGDSLLFSAGLLAGLVDDGGREILNIVWLNVVLIAAAIAGDAVNYHLGYVAGTKIFEHGRVPLVKIEHLLAAKIFYERHGGKAIVLARFMPLVRTFTPFVAGVAKMGYAQFVVYNVVGGVAWVLSMTLAGYWLGQREWVRDHFEKVVFGIIFISLLPMMIAFVRHRLARRRTVGTPA